MVLLLEQVHCVSVLILLIFDILNCPAGLLLECAEFAQVVYEIRILSGLLELLNDLLGVLGAFLIVLLLLLTLLKELLGLRQNFEGLLIEAEILMSSDNYNRIIQGLCHF